MKTACVLVAALAMAIPAAAQTGAAQTPANPLTAATKSAYDMIKGNITKSALVVFVFSMLSLGAALPPAAEQIM